MELHTVLWLEPAVKLGVWVRKHSVALIILGMIVGCAARADTEILLGAIKNLDARISVTNTTVSNYDKWAIRLQELTDLLSTIGRYWVYIFVVVLIAAPLVTYVTGKAVWNLGRRVKFSVYNRKGDNGG